MELGVTVGPGRRGAPRWSEALAVIVMAGLPGEGPVLGQGLKGVAAGGAWRLVFERQGLSLERSEWCLSRGSFEICVLWEVAS